MRLFRSHCFLNASCWRCCDHCHHCFEPWCFRDFMWIGHIDSPHQMLFERKLLPQPAGQSFVPAVFFSRCLFGWAEDWPSSPLQTLCNPLFFASVCWPYLIPCIPSVPPYHIPGSPFLHWPGLQLFSLSARFICSSQCSTSSWTPLSHKPLDQVTALLQYRYQCNSSAILLSLSEPPPLPEPLASWVLASPSGPLATISDKAASSVESPTVQAPHTAELSWAELREAVLCVPAW